MSCQCGCVVEVDSGFRTRRIIARLATHDGATVVWPSPRDLDSASRYRPHGSLKSIWVGFDGENKGSPAHDGGESDAPPCPAAVEGDRVQIEGLSRWVASVASDRILSRYITALHPCPLGQAPFPPAPKDEPPCSAAESLWGAADDEAELVSTIKAQFKTLHLRGEPRDSLGPIRLQVRAGAGEKHSALLRRLGTALAAPPDSLVFSPTQYRSTLTVVDDRGASTRHNQAEGPRGQLLYSVLPRAVLAPFVALKQQAHAEHEMCRAAWKLREALESGRESDRVMPSAAAGLRRLDGPLRGIDLGAAPGGWTTVLTEHCGDVVAVDPADLDPSVLAHPSVRHLQMQTSEAVRTLTRERSQALEDGAAPPDGFAIVVSDMNSGGWGEGTAQMVVEVATAGLLRDSAVLVLTVKGCEKASAAQLANQVGRITAVLEAGHFAEVRGLQMLANTAWERTITAVWKQPDPPVQPDPRVA